MIKIKYEVILESFEGPLDLLYHLIEKEKVDIYDIPISKITDQYIEHINAMKEFDLEVTSEFLIMASTLIEIKSKMLLPKVKKEEIEDEDGLDPREELVRKLIEYKKYKEASLELKAREDTYKKIYYKAREEIEYYEEELDLEGVDLSTLMELYENILEKGLDLPKDTEFEEIKRDEITIEESIRDVLYTLNLKKKIKFQDLFEANSTKAVIVTTFLAILELIKQKSISIKQENNFSEIYVELKIS